jgi:hypothetical protein
MTTAQDGGKVVSLKHRPPLHRRIIFKEYLIKVKVKVKQSCYRPGVSQKVPGS